MKRLLQSIREMLGAAPLPRPRGGEVSDSARGLHGHKRAKEVARQRVSAIRTELAESPRKRVWSRRRWISIAAVNLLFVLSYHLDIQMVEGALTGSRVIGFHFADLNAALQVMLAYQHIVVNLVIGTVTVFILWGLLGGRSFCSWVCPYHLLSELAEKLHLRLAAAHLVQDFPLHRGLRTILYAVFAVLAVATGYTVFEAVSPVGILSRAMIYGPGLALLWVAGLLAWEVFITRRGWCRYLCPIGLTYGLVGIVSPVRVVYDLRNCYHEGQCRKVCLVPHALEVTKKGYAREARVALGPDCTRCGMCVEVCPTGSLKFEIKGLSRIP